MVVMAFFLLMVVIFFAALFFIILNLIFIFIWNVKKRNGKNPKRRYVIIPTIFLIINIILELIPIGWVAILRSANSSASKDFVKAKSGKIVYWGDDTIDSFKMDDINYVDSSLVGSKDTWKLGKPIANIKSKYNEEGFNKFMAFLFAYEDTSTLYPVINKSGFKLYTIGNDIYCPENMQDSILAYYKDITNYNMKNCRYEYNVFAEKKSNEALNRKTHIYYKKRYKNVTLNQGIFKKIYQIDNSQNLKTIKIPQKYINIENSEKLGSSTSGYEYRNLYVYSIDKVIEKNFELDLINGHIYCSVGCGYGYIKGYLLTDEINQYLKNIIFKDKE